MTGNAAILSTILAGCPPGKPRWPTKKGIKVVMAELLTGPGSRSPGPAPRLQRIINRTLKRLAPAPSSALFSIGIPDQLADACVALTGWEA